MAGRPIGLWTALLVIAISGTASALTEIGGDLPLRVTADKSPYIVKADLYVPSGKTVTIDPGCVFLFRNFTGLKVLGVLLAPGTAAKPVVFSSESDQEHNPSASTRANAYDWNGIYLDKDAMGSDLQHVHVLYSVYGIVSMTKFIRIVEGVFRDNGRGDLTVEGTAHTVTQEPYSYSLSVRDAAVDGVPVRILTDPQAAKRNTVRYSAAGACLAGCLVGAVYTNKWLDAGRRLSDMSSTDLSNLVQNDNAAWSRTRDEKYADLWTAVGGYVVAIAGAAGLRWSFTF
jgi:hypothetical protein